MFKEVYPTSACRSRLAAAMAEGERGNSYIIKSGNQIISRQEMTPSGSFNQIAVTLMSNKCGNLALGFTGKLKYAFPLVIYILPLSNCAANTVFYI